MSNIVAYAEEVATEIRYLINDMEYAENSKQFELAISKIYNKVKDFYTLDDDGTKYYFIIIDSDYYKVRVSGEIDDNHQPINAIMEYDNKDQNDYLSLHLERHERVALLNFAKLFDFLYQYQI